MNGRKTQASYALVGQTGPRQESRVVYLPLGQWMLSSAQDFALASRQAGERKRQVITGAYGPCDQYIPHFEDGDMSNVVVDVGT